MSVKRKKASLVFSWQKSLSILAPWRKGKGDMVLDSEVVLTKMKLFNNFHERLIIADDTVSTTSTVSVSKQDSSEPFKAPEVNSRLDNMSGQPPMESGSDYLSTILPQLYKFESDDSGVELPSGANSPSTPMGSEQSFVVHSRNSSCDSCNLNAPAAVPDTLLTCNQESEVTQASKDLKDNLLKTTVDARDSILITPEGLASSVDRGKPHTSEDMEGRQCTALMGSSQNGKETCEQLDEKTTATDSTDSESARTRSRCSSEACDNMTDGEFEQRPLRRSTTSDSLEEYMEECCRLSEVQQASANPLGSGLGYLEHICQLIEKIGQLQESNLRLQRQICGLQKDGRMSRTKEDFFQQHCQCGAASLAFQSSSQKGPCGSSSGTLTDLSTIPEGARHPFTSPRKDISSSYGSYQLLAPVPLWRRGLNRRSYAEGEAQFLYGSSEGLSIPHRRLSENHTWGRVKDLVKKTKLRNQNQLGLTSASLKMSCPQLYRPDLGPVDLSSRTRNSMISLGQHSKLDFPWLH